MTLTITYIENMFVVGQTVVLFNNKSKSLNYITNMCEVQTVIYTFYFDLSASASNADKGRQYTFGIIPRTVNCGWSNNSPVIV